jgi:hypothetical protein
MGNAIIKRLGEHAGSLKALAAAVGPYVILELFVPGGTALAFLLFLHRRKAGMARPRIEETIAEPDIRDHGAAQPFATMAACGVILALMLAA